MVDVADRIAALSPAQRALLQDRLRAAGLTVPGSDRIRPRADRAQAPLSFAQERILFDDAFGLGSARYNEACAFDVTGPLDRELLARTLTEIVRRHQVLRSRFDIKDGRPSQSIEPAVDIVLPVIDLTDLPEWLRDEACRQACRREATTPINLEQAPLIRAKLLKTAEHRHRLVVTIHHIVCDGWSLRLFMAEAAAIYRAFRDGT